MTPKSGPEIPCKACGKTLSRKRINGRMEDFTVFLRRKYCDRACMARAMTKTDPSRSAISKRTLKFRKEQCDVCHTIHQLGVHHVDQNPMNNDPSNLMTLCAHCHTTWHWENGKSWPKERSACNICGTPARKSGYCQMHYQRFKKYGDPLLTKKRVGSRFELFREVDGLLSGPA